MKTSDMLRRAKGSDILPTVVLGALNAELLCLRAAKELDEKDAQIEKLTAPKRESTLVGLRTVTAAITFQFMDLRKTKQLTFETKKTGFECILEAQKSVVEHLGGKDMTFQDMEGNSHILCLKGESQDAILDQICGIEIMESFLK